MHRLAAEALGTGFLLISVIGSGIMGVNLAGGNVAIALLANAIATGCMLYVIITTLGPISGAHFNPAVSLAFFLRGELGASDLAGYVVAQVIGGVLGVWAAHVMFDLPLLQWSETMHRTGTAQWFAEGIATFGLLFVIFGGLRARPRRCRRSWRSTSRGPIGSPPRPALPTPLLPSRGGFRTRLPASTPPTSRCSS